MRAQSDSSRHGGYIPLFDNLTSPDVPLPNENDTLRQIPRRMEGKYTTIRRRNGGWI